MKSITKLMRINDNDNVAVSLTEIKSGEKINIEKCTIKALENIPIGHKIAITGIKKGENVIKYGYSIGIAKEDIECGKWIHFHNIQTGLSDILEYNYNPREINFKSYDGPETFKGFRRKNGLVGIRNEMWIVPTVGCVNGIAEMIIKKFKEKVNINEIDGIEVFKHNYGCSQLGDDHENTKTILSDIAKHPNSGGVLVLGLGCENNTMNEFVDSLGDYDYERIKFITSQDVTDEIEEGVKALEELYSVMKEDRREDIHVSELKVGLKCGGSDGFSGITANPLLGRFSDYLIKKGGTTILTEVPEMFGAETILMDRAENKVIFEKIVSLINNFKKYFIDNKCSIYENPSPGNKKGGISTLEDKSLGCTQKGGQAKVSEVLDYGEITHKKGLNLLCAPGNDLVASTALGASGCHMVLFTTGRGTPFGSFVPTVKISSNSRIAKQKSHWIDFNAGGLLEGRNMEEVTKEFIEYIIQVASGEYVNNEKNGFREIAIFKTGVTL